MIEKIRRSIDGELFRKNRHESGTNGVVAGQIIGSPELATVNYLRMIATHAHADP
jgi:hypothetical protein